MRAYLSIAMLFCLLLGCERSKPRVLVFSKTKGYRHESIGVGKTALIELGKKNGFEVDTTEDAAFFNEETLKRYRAVVFLSTTQNVLDPVQQADFKRFIEAGGGFVGIHAAADTEYEWPWYGKLVGAWFKSHPKTQEAVFRKVKDFGDGKLPDAWKRTDELYNYKNISPDINVLFNLDESTYEGGENGDNHPIAWYHDFEGGRSFYTGMGHTPESYSDAMFLDHLLQGIRYAIGEEAPDYTKAKSERAPEENRFTKTVLDFNLDEPTEMAVLPDGKILFVERKGAVKLYTPADGTVKTVNTFNVGTKFEDGMIGLAIDPKFGDNHWIYIFYAHPEKSANIVSRFEFKDDKVDVASEKQLLEVATQRETCCHTGGSLAFDPQGNLYISTGDNTSPFESDGYSPSDEQAGRSPFDAQKSSANTNDLRGKILRITPQPDGTYTIPEGNLFAKGEAQTRPEIYVMGCRNPYRISIDQKTGFLYWGEVGPDAGKNDSLRGPRGYDEVNQAKKAGFFGWPYFVGKNYAYAKYDFKAKKVNEPWDAAAPLNNSPNNTGKKDLPPVSPPFIWYPYTKSDDFPMVRDGGRNAMAGPVYYAENFKGVDTAFPAWFEGKLMIYDWIRNWIFLVTMDDAGAIKDIEPFMSHSTFNNIIDMQYGPDGRLYMIEYGTAWFKQNLDARLVRIDYNPGNRVPVAKLTADKTTGAVPLTVNFSAKGSIDYDGDKLTYELEAAGKKQTSADGKFTVEFTQPGAQAVKLIVKDDKGNQATASTQVSAGNEPPAVKVEITGGNRTFFFPGVPVDYNVTVTDKEDGTTSGGINPADVTVTFDYVKGYDVTHVAQGHQKPTAELPGLALIAKSDCKSCHMIDQKSAGPSYKDVAAKYKGSKDAVGTLAAKVIKGGAGVWGTTEMAAHPQVSVDDAKKMVEYILSLADEKAVQKLPLKGSVKPRDQEDGVYILTATYYDKGAGTIKSLSSSDAVALRNRMVTPNQADTVINASRISLADHWYIDNIVNGSQAVFRHLDLSDIAYVKFFTTRNGKSHVGGTVEMHLDKPDGPLWAKADITDDKQSLTRGSDVKPMEGYHDVYLVFKNEGFKNNATGELSLFMFAGFKFEFK